MEQKPQITDILTKIKTPLDFCAKDSFKRLANVKNLQAIIPQYLSELADATDSNLRAAIEKDISEFKNLFAAFGVKEIKQKEQTISQSITILDKIRIVILSGENNKHTASRAASNTEIAANEMFSLPVQFIKGVGPRIAALLAKKGLNSVEDMLYFLPHCYEDRRNITNIAKSKIGEKVTIVGEIITSEYTTRGRRRIFRAAVSDGVSSLQITWFHGSTAYLAQTFKAGKRVIITGEIKSFNHAKSMYHPDFEILDGDDNDMLHLKRIVPVYSKTEGMQTKMLRRIMAGVVEKYAPLCHDNIPPSILKKRNLMTLADAIKNAHFPPDGADIEMLNSMSSEYHRRIVYEDFFFLNLGMALRKKTRFVENGISFRIDNNLLESFYRQLPFTPTNAQKRVISEIARDMEKHFAMNRLLQGDVGSGKTLAAMIAILIACKNNYQATIMAPTELLAQQHYTNIAPQMASLGIKSVLLIGSQSAAVREKTLAAVESGNAKIIIGTHAIFQEQVKFNNLGLAVIDEQHRFGVAQRLAIKNKGLNPDILVMTATPIPRTLAMTVYGDLDVSVLDELPPHKKPIETKIYYDHQREKVYARINKELESGNQVFVVCPLVEESETLCLKDATNMAKHFQEEIFSAFRVGLLHGRMKAKEKDEVMLAFKERKIQLLVATTVVEVGIDILFASLIVIENAERFGLSQLHQLRGRVGRGPIKSSCILLAQHAASKEARQRLKIMEATNDGFKIAEEDLAIRGPGEFLGIRQSGLPDFRVGNIVRDVKILAQTREDAFALIEADVHLEKDENRSLRNALTERWQGRLKLIRA